jgi:hypothetical protein
MVTLGARFSFVSSAFAPVMVSSFQWTPPLDVLHMPRKRAREVPASN